MLSLTRRVFPTVLNIRRLSAVPNATVSLRPDALEGEQQIHAKLVQRFNPSLLSVQDVSGGCGTFYAITIASEAFQGLPIVKQHKLVTQVLKQDIEGIHGLQIKTMVQ